MNELSEFDKADLKWKQKTLRARHWLKPDTQLSFNRWMEKGGKRFDWPDWEILCGPKPVLIAQKKLTVRISERRKSA
jgi:hypothetical protein